MKCNKCGIIYNNNEKFCKQCGMPLSNDMYYQPYQNNMIYNKPFVPKRTSNVGLVVALVVSFLILIPLVIFFIFLFAYYDSSNNYHSYKGEYDCRKDLLNEYIVTLDLEDDDEFKWSKYNDEEKNYIKGEYTIEDSINGDNYSSNYDYYKSYSIYLDGQEYVRDGNLQLSDVNSNFKMEYIVDDDEEKLILYEAKTNTTFMCKKR